MLLQSTESVLNKHGWQFYDLGKTTLRIDVNGKTANWAVIVKCIDEDQQFVVYSVCGNKPTEDKYTVMQEFLTRANFGLRIGNFELDLQDGEIRFKTSIQFAGEVQAELMIEQCLLINIMTMDRYLPGILQVIFTDISPEQAIAQIESQT
ncbi:YbjN domain-containing protein [Anabaenopsis sp. FSS-46]|uniref:YbjN domain-containing protein n=1 Tax=Nostocales TaxID=1161 RepID=UPI0023315417|nr:MULTISPECIES: YbjN domain-containing protein [Nostocales]MDB9445873.1 YbjN domain-containing protein [Anabaena sp. CS-542/02]MDH6098619.1 YbjN domain-containing protein [Anabaenopsis sp. FSS-46]